MEEEHEELGPEEGNWAVTWHDSTYILDKNIIYYKSVC